jgi:hypothetical protein
MIMTSVLGAVLAALLAAGAGVGGELVGPANYVDTADTHGFVTKEWSWSDGTSILTFTAYGPPEQVNGLNPEHGVSGCPDCRLASSVHFGPADPDDSDLDGALGLAPISPWE